MISNKKYEVILGYAPHKEGSFYLYNPETQRFGSGSACREIFEGYFNSQRKKWLVFASNVLNVKKLNKFFNIVEIKLKIQDKDKTVFYLTNEKYAVVIKVSNFWLTNSAYRGFFTLFLRCGAVYYDGKNFDKSFESYNLARNIIKPIKMFLGGYSKINKRINYGDLVETLEEQNNLTEIFKRETKYTDKKTFKNFMLDMSILK